MQMPSWLTFLLPVATYVGGVLSKPLQEAIADWRTRKNLRKGLYADLAHILDLVTTAMTEVMGLTRDQNTPLATTFALESYEHALANPLLFHHLRESNRLFYERVNSLEGSSAPGR